MARDPDRGARTAGGPYAIGTALEAAGLRTRVCRTWAGERVPDTVDGRLALVVMGGSMAAYDDFPSRTGELALLRAALEAEAALADALAAGPPDWRPGQPAPLILLAG
ncbi:hypothetical protein [Streptomyces phaeofaciens]|uniref:hypothetical protein n=1 Tax=Streptomyces phaeofaciens TaxID=68254 RepID=UPI0036B0BCCF